MLFFFFSTEHLYSFHSGMLTITASALTSDIDIMEIICSENNPIFSSDAHSSSVDLSKVTLLTVLEDLVTCGNYRYFLFGIYFL